MSAMEQLFEDLADANERVRAAALLQLCRSRHRLAKGTVQRASDLVLRDETAIVRGAALHLLVRRSRLGRALIAWTACCRDIDATVRLRCTQLAPHLATRFQNTESLAAHIWIVDALLTAANDADGFVAESACFALGEIVVESSPGLTSTLEILAAHASSHNDPLVRESAVAALGSIGHVSSANVIIAACSDKPAIRRRAVLALAAFAGPEIDAALAKALTDPDWQVRQAAEDLTGYDNDDNTAGDDRD